jgi:hypothetical protein
MEMSYEQLPSFVEWPKLTRNTNKISMRTVFNSKQADVMVLRYLLERLRLVVKSKPLVHTGKRHRSEESFRKEVHDEPDKFRFDGEMLQEYSPYHLSEMMQIIISMLKERGVDARVEKRKDAFALPNTPFNRIV